MTLENGNHSSSDYQIVLEFQNSERQFIHSYYEWLDTFSQIGGTKSIVAQFFTFLMPYFIMRYFYKFGMVIKEIQEIKLRRKFKKLADRALVCFGALDVATLPEEINEDVPKLIEKLKTAERSTFENQAARTALSGTGA